MSLDQIFFPNEETEKSTGRRQPDSLLAGMSSRDLTIMTATEKGIRKLGVEHFDTGTLKREKTEMFIELYKAGLVKDMSHMGLWKVSFTLREF